MLTYENYSTPAEFNAGYANSITAEVVQKWETLFREDSANTLANAPGRRELIYGPKERNRIDFFPAQIVAADDAPAPLLVAIHGGLWFLFDQWMMHFLAEAFTRRGFHVAAVNYPLAPAHSLGEIVGDCRAAVRWLYEHAGELGVRREEISVLGHSAAGQLCAMVGAARWEEIDPALPPQIVRRCVGVSGFYDIEPFRLTEFQPLVGFSEAEYRRWNPMRNVAAHLPETLLVTGGLESPLLHQMAAHYAGALRAAGVSAEAIAPAGECHFSVLRAIGDPNTTLFGKVYAFLSKGNAGER